MPELIRLTLRLAFWEALILVGGTVLMPSPSVLALMAVFACVYLVADSVQRFEILSPVLGDERFLPRAYIASFLGVATLGIYVLVSPPLTYLLWSSGAFGEPPWNRSVRVFFPSDDEVGIEWGVSVLPMNGLNVGFVDPTMAFDRSKAARWFLAKPGLDRIPVEKDRRDIVGVKEELNTRISVSMRSEGYGITPERSLYAVRGITREVCVLRCWLRSNIEEGGHECFEDIDVAIDGESHWANVVFTERSISASILCSGGEGSVYLQSR